MNAPHPVSPIWAPAAEDVRTLAWLHAQERPAALWVALYRHGFPHGLSLGGHEEVAELADGLQALARQLAEQPGETLRADDLLAADYADIYLTHAFKASPYESVWRDEDRLMMQGPTFDVRACYRRHGLAVATDWRSMPDDHLAHELAFVAHLLDQGNVVEAASFLDAHLMTWLPDFAAQVGHRARTRVYAGLARLTLSLCRQLRAALVVSTDEVPPTG